MAECAKDRYCGTTQIRMASSMVTWRYKKRHCTRTSSNWRRNKINKLHHTNGNSRNSRVSRTFRHDANVYNDKTLIRTTAYCIAFLQKTSICKRKKIFPFENTPPIFQAHMWWLKSIQQHAFRHKIELIRKKKTNPTIQRLRLFLDNQGILRAAGRLTDAPLSYYKKNPILLPHPREYPFVKLLITASHTATLHAGTNQTLAHIQKNYWLFSGRCNVYNVIRQCAVCKKERARPFQQRVNSDLPKFHLTNDCHTFTYIGIDVAGHFSWTLV